MIVFYQNINKYFINHLSEMSPLVKLSKISFLN